MNVLDSQQVRERARIARGVLTLAFAVLGAAFFRAQVLQHEKYRLRAETNRLRPLPLQPPRGVILDWRGEIVAENVPGFAVKLLAPSEDSLRAVLGRLRAIVPVDAEAERGIVSRYRAARYQPVTVFRDASVATVARLEEHRPLLPGLVVQAEPRRFYPAGPAVAHVVGYTSEATDEDIARDSLLGPGSIVGRAGLERQYDRVLRGREGIRYVEVNARGGLVRDEPAAPSLPPVGGRLLRTTLDVDLQRYIDSIWPKGMRGAMLAMTPAGEIRALYSAPGYDPNAFIGGIPAELWRELNTDEARPLLNRAIRGIYPPASPFKLATAAMGLRRGLVTMRSRMPVGCSGGFRLGNRVFKCWKKEGHGDLDLTGAIAKSCDVYFYQLGLKLGLEAIIEDGRLLGFRDPSGIDLPGEQSPIYPESRKYFDDRYGPRGWSAPATVLNFSIGQGENTQTLINMVKFYQALAGDGTEVQPYLVPPATPKRRAIGLDSTQLAGLRQALIAVVERGTAVASRREGLAIAGKTGTAQNPHGKDHGWFIGFAPAERPELVVGAIMEFAEHGSDVAPYVASVLRRYVLGKEAPAAPPRPLPIERDSAPGDVEQAPDTAVAAGAGR